MPTDIEIANAAKPFKISRIAAKLDLTDEDIIPYGHYMAKISRAQTAAFARPATQPTTKTSPAVTDTATIARAARTACAARTARAARTRCYTSPNQNLCRSHAKGSKSANIACQPKLVAQPLPVLEVNLRPRCT